MDDILNMPIILASTSPRRIELLRQVGIDARVLSPSADETALRGEKPERLVSRLARLKAESVVMDVLREGAGGLVIGADTVVVSPDGRKVLGKPKDAADAVRMLASLAGRTHLVLTGYCVLCVAREMNTERISRVVRSRVSLRKLPRKVIEQYVATGEPMDKAGSYAAQGLGMALIEKINGSYANVVGLPVAQLLMDIERKFEVSPLSLGVRNWATASVSNNVTPS